MWELGSSRRGLCESAWGGREGITKQATLKEEGEFIRWTWWKGMPGRGNSTCRGSETWKHVTCSRKGTWSGTAGEWGVWGEGGEAGAWGPFSLLSHQYCLWDFFPCVNYNVGLNSVLALPSARSPVLCSIWEILLIFQGPALTNPWPPSPTNHQVRWACPPQDSRNPDTHLWFIPQRKALCLVLFKIYFHNLPQWLAYHWHSYICVFFSFFEFVISTWNMWSNGLNTAQSHEHWLGSQTDPRSVPISGITSLHPSFCVKMGIMTLEGKLWPT